jgi:integrase
MQNERFRQDFVLADDLLNRLKTWKQVSQFGEANHWIFASPIQLESCHTATPGFGRNLCALQRLLGHVSTHSFRHSYRSWLSSIGTGLDVTKLLMRHSTIAMSMDTYGDLIGDEASKATLKIAEFAFRGDRAQSR